MSVQRTCIVCGSTQQTVRTADDAFAIFRIEGENMQRDFMPNTHDQHVRV